MDKIIRDDPRLRDDFDGLIHGHDLSDGLTFLYEHGQAPGDVVVAWLRKNGEARDEV